ncbi:MAG TPA: tryptophan-rich sensory protein [Pyrinomonadaceae bacterium]|nr:tryptophan-rich sensory protein [Pyrinomonadaceae bacterium]
MSIGFAILVSLGVCVISAILEGVFAGRNVKQYFARLRHPSYALPLWGWYVIGGFYYVIFGVVLYRILRQEGNATARNIALALLLLMMSVNAFWNYVFFRVRNLFVSFFAFTPYLFFAVALFVFLLQFDRIAAWLILLYLLYLIYAASWGYRLWILNRSSN